MGSLQVPTAQSGFIHIPAGTTERISYPGLKDKTTGSTFISPFLCNQIILLHGEGERRRKKRKCFLLISGLTATATMGANNSNFIQGVRRKSFPVTKLPWQRNFPITESSNKFFRNEHYLKHLLHENWRRPSPFLVWLRSPLPGLPKLIPQYNTCRNQEENYRHALSDKYFQEMRICAIQ